jgi:uncharacterized protein
MKLASRCNLDCDYCYVYNAGDESWRRQPKFMSEAVMLQSALNIRNHAETHGLRDININFHGGEPLLAGLRRLEQLSKVLNGVFADRSIRINSVLQTNGLLLNSEIIHWLIDNDVRLMVSLDGPSVVNDTHRRDRRGRPSGERVEQRLSELSGPDFDKIFQGFLVVVDPRYPGSKVIDHLLRYRPRALDFLLPLNNYDNHEAADYGAWMIECFNHWFDNDLDVRVRSFERYITRLLYPDVNEINPIDALIVESDGGIEIDDTLKTSFSGASSLGFNIFNDSFDNVLESSSILRWREAMEPAPQCCDCSIYQVCRGGHVSHRYSQARGFANPSVYCLDLKAFISHIRSRIIAKIGATRDRRSGSGV